MKLSELNEVLSDDFVVYLDVPGNISRSDGTTWVGSRKDFSEYGEKNVTLIKPEAQKGYIYIEIGGE